MSYYKHYFRCAACGKHLFTTSESDIPGSPGRTHGEALENATKLFRDDPDDPSCGGLGVIRYCSGSNPIPGQDWTNPSSYAKCTSHTHGTEEIAVHTPSAPPVAWTDFATRVHAAWTAFVNSGYSPALRGANNHREYPTDAKVSSILRASGGVVSIHGGVYASSNSLHAGASLKRSIPPAYQVGNILSFIWHL